MDALETFHHLLELRSKANVMFGIETADEIDERARKYAEKSEMHRHHVLAIAIQVESEWPGQTMDYFDEVEKWVERTAEDHHPHNRELYIKAMTWVIMKRRAEVS